MILTIKLGDYEINVEENKKQNAYLNAIFTDNLLNY